MSDDRTRTRAALVTAALLASMVGACAATGGSSPTASAVGAVATASPTPEPTASPTPTPTPTPIHNPTEVIEGTEYRPTIDVESFTTTVDNPYMPLVPGTVMTYEGAGERIVVTVTPATREVMGVTTVVVHDQAFEDGALIEDTQDWYAQDAAGNVWYFGEDTAECEDGKVTSTAGAWEGGVDGAQPGVVMLSDPQVGDYYRQEFYKGEAEDVARVLEVGSSLTIPLATYDDVLVTEDFTPLEPKFIEHKSYARGVGVVQEQLVKGGDEMVRLIEVSTGGPTSAPAPGPFEPCQE